MRIGCIFAAWQCADLLPASLAPWVEAKRAALGGHHYSICAVSVPFEGFPQDEERDRTRSILGAHAQLGEIDHVVVGDKPHKETDARGAALRWLMTQGVDVTIMVDSDETWTAEQIEATFRFVAAQPWVTMFRVPYRNLVFTPQQWLATPFTPPRVHRIYGPGGYVASEFYDDNNVLYRRPWEPQTAPAVRDIDMANMTIPLDRWVAHETWLSNDRSRCKAAYQSLRWSPPHGAGCAFRWDEARGLVWNEEHFRLTGQPIPEVVTE